MSTDRTSAWTRLAAEMALRVGLVFVVWHGFPQVYWVDAQHYWTLFRTLGLHHLPYRDFLWEFPPLTIVPVAAAALLKSSEYAFAIYLAALMAALELATLKLLERESKDRQVVAGYWYPAALPIATLAWFRLDFLAVLLGTAALVASRRNRDNASTGAIVAGVLAKLWPALVGLAVVWDRRWRQALTIGAATAVAVAAWYTFSPSGFDAFLRYRRGTGFHVESLAGSLLMLVSKTRPVFRSGAWVVDAGRYGWLEPAMLALWVVVVAILTWAVWRRPGVHQPALLGAVVAGLMLASRLFSPQYLVWLLPFLVLARVDGERVATGIFVGAVAATTVYLWGHAELLDGNRVLEVIVVLRNGLLLVMAAVLVRWSFQGAAAPPARSRPGPRRR